MATTQKSKPIWIITQRGSVVPLAELPSGESAKWWCFECDSKWTRGDPPNVKRKEIQKIEPANKQNQIRAF